MSAEKYVIFVLGGPGAGKGTQCKMITEKYPIKHLSAGDLLRAAVKSGSKDGELINTIIKEGKIVPAQITIELLIKAMKEDKHQVFFIDGFPRNEENRSEWFRISEGSGITAKYCVCFDVSEQEMLKRVIGRSASSGRVDDNVTSMQKRITTYNTETKVVLDKFASDNMLVKIDGSLSVEEVNKTFSKFIEDFLTANNISKEMI